MSPLDNVHLLVFAHEIIHFLVSALDNAHLLVFALDNIHFLCLLMIIYTSCVCS